MYDRKQTNAPPRLPRAVGARRRLRAPLPPHNSWCCLCTGSWTAGLHQLPPGYIVSNALEIGLGHRSKLPQRHACVVHRSLRTARITAEIVLLIKRYTFIVRHNVSQGCSPWLSRLRVWSRLAGTLAHCPLHGPRERNDNQFTNLVLLGEDVLAHGANGQRAARASGSAEGGRRARGSASAKRGHNSRSTTRELLCYPQQHGCSEVERCSTCSAYAYGRRLLKWPCHLLGWLPLVCVTLPRRPSSMVKWFSG